MIISQGKSQRNWKKDQSECSASISASTSPPPSRRTKLADSKAKAYRPFSNQHYTVRSYRGGKKEDTYRNNIKWHSLPALPLSPQAKRIRSPQTRITNRVSDTLQHDYCCIDGGFVWVLHPVWNQWESRNGGAESGCEEEDSWYRGQGY